MKQRLDILLVERGLAASRNMAQGMIMAGQVRQGTTVLSKPGMQIEDDIEITLSGGPKYVSRGGAKLESVASELNLDFKDSVLLDVGSSTGGFTDFALQNGATKVFAIDVGNNQLAYKLRQDSRVVVMERTDIRKVTPEQLSPTPDLAVIDVSFISLTKVLPAVASLIQPEAPVVAMAKPQFETDKATAAKYQGVIKDEKVRQKILSDFEKAIQDQFEIIAAADSGIPGTEGNIERFYLLKARR